LISGTISPTLTTCDGFNDGSAFSDLEGIPKVVEGPWICKTQSKNKPKTEKYPNCPVGVFGRISMPVKCRKLPGALRF
jgi:hypothetical protein